MKIRSHPRILFSNIFCNIKSSTGGTHVALSAHTLLHVYIIVLCVCMCMEINYIFYTVIKLSFIC